MKRKRAGSKKRPGDGEPRHIYGTHPDRRGLVDYGPAALISVRTMTTVGGARTERNPVQHTRRANRKARAAGFFNGADMLRYLSDMLTKMKGRRL